MAEQGFTTEDCVLEVGCVGGGCSGFKFKLGFKERAEINPDKEAIVEQQGVTLVINHRAALYMTGTVIDFHDGLIQRGFVFNNPLAAGKCGCGSSFSV